MRAPSLMKKIAFLSCDDLEGYVVDDHLLVEELSGNYDVSTISWSANADWKSFDAVIVRTTWDYVQRFNEFMPALEKIQRSGTRLFNSYSVVNWNVHKSYLLELESRGIRIVPTLLFQAGQSFSLPDTFTQKRFILKPAISATAFKTRIFTREEILDGAYATHATDGDWLLQPFLEEIHQGELSLIFFDKKFSHAIRKVPKAGDFRVQEEFGGEITAFDPDKILLSFATEAIEQVDFPQLYARVDLVVTDRGPCLMELELIEPSLYFRTCPKAARNFHEAIRTYV